MQKTAKKYFSSIKNTFRQYLSHNEVGGIPYD